MDEKEVINLLDSIEKDVHESIWPSLKTSIHSTYMPELKFGEERPFEESDFSNHQLIVYKNIKILQLIFKQLNTTVKLKKEFHDDIETVCDVILLCGEYLNQELWTTREIIETSQDLLSAILQLLNFEHLTELLFEFKSDFIRTLFVKLRPKLLKDTWKRYPAAVACYKWLLFEIKSPILSNYLETVLPTALIILDDHEFHNRIKGMQCIEHIINNITRTELNWYGRGALLYKTLEPMVYFREPELLPSLISCLIALLKKTECDPSGLNGKWSHFDDIFNIWLPGMEMEQKIASRIINLDCLSDFLWTAGLLSSRWTQKLLNIISQYSADNNTCQKSLETLLVLIEVTWPRVHLHCDAVFIILMKVAMDLSDIENSSISPKIVPLLKMCLNKIKEVAPEKIDKLMVDVSQKRDLRSAYYVISSPAL